MKKVSGRLTLLLLVMVVSGVSVLPERVWKTSVPSQRQPIRPQVETKSASYTFER